MTNIKKNGFFRLSYYFTLKKAFLHNLRKLYPFEELEFI